MNSLLVLSWVGMGVFVAWIGTHLVRDRSRGGGVGNLAVCVLGALLGGLGAHAALRGAHGYHPFIICVGRGADRVGASPRDHTFLPAPTQAFHRVLILAGSL